MQLLETQISCNMMDQETYRRKLQLAIRQEEGRAKKLLKKQDKSGAQDALKRIQLMKEELGAS